jgi:ABC-2 type transport system ATP-binding protein
VNERAIGCRELTKRFGRRRALENVSFDVSRGEICGFLGRNGAGKTTTIRILLGLLFPSDGWVSVLGETPPLSAARARQIGFALEQPPFYPWLTARENLRSILWANRGRLEERDLDRSLARVGLSQDAGRKVKEFSHGMRQRLALACALAPSPDVMVIDEPTTGLDPAGIRDVRAILREEAERGCAVLLSSHLLSEVEKACDRVVVLEQGRLVASGTFEELGGLDQRVEVQVRAEDLPQAIRALTALDVVVRPDGRLLISGSSGREVLELLYKERIVPDSVTDAPASLEERFLEITSRNGADT